MVRMPILFALILIAAPAGVAHSSNRETGWKVATGGVALGVATRTWHAVDVGDIAAVADDMPEPRFKSPRIDPSRVGEDAAVYGKSRPTGMIAHVSARLTF